MTSFICCN